jgi:hypothetical protein
MGYEIFWEPKGVVKRFFGQVTNDDMMQAVVKTEGDRRFDALRYVINDCLAIEKLSLTADEVDNICPEMTRMALQYANSPLNAYPTRIFPTLAEARFWLGVPDYGDVANR